MGKSKAQKAAEKAAFLKELEEKYNSLSETATEVEKAELQKQIDEAKAELEELEPKGTVEVEFIKSPTGAPFFLAYNKDDSASIDVKQAAELIEAGIAVKK
ncbi:MAG: hypothetical protein CMP76_17225 [Flavobacterium sp.]|uniref:hypothetical protein n=1 Tax=Flavobacterium sp. TaxID=239 RepID=UPI000C67D690|nr:hypothetical protein [Flavobacterium sp.]MBF05021.1 hypothetical protein [Flavobacterium sp.]|tara:strand:- start:871 stop:1173 length:303 start_codon:yes stop_codon:yes gene_type:complete